jgi:hypothetical protein
LAMTIRKRAVITTSVKATEPSEKWSWPP